MTSSGYVVTDAALQAWQPLLGEWIESFERLCNFTGTTPLWNCVEESNTGPFVGAAWRLGWAGLPQAKCRRASLGGWGMADLYLAYPPEGIAAYVEFKGAKVASASRAAACLREAVWDASSIIDSTVPMRLAVAFCNVQFSAIGPHHVTNLTERLLEDIHRGVRCGAIAWCFPPSVLEYEEEPGIFTPGVVVLLTRA